MLHAITFDFWGTLYQNAHVRDERLRLLEKALASHSQPRPRVDLEAAYRYAWSVWEQTWREERRSITTEHWLHKILAFLEADLPEDVVTGLRQPIEESYLHSDLPQPVPGVSDVIPNLSRRYRLGIISDTGLTPGRVLREILRRDGLLDYFRVLTFSDETGMAKPMPAQFLRTLDILEVQPEKAAHIGDLPETDLTGARAVGMKAVLFLGVSNRQDGHSLADAVFEEYNELEELLESLGRTIGQEVKR
ncbi:MAG: HAD family hydrolase [Chloroflexota bacterium]|nr:HAD family hydrolase [Chloroflexota bacterium]